MQQSSSSAALTSARRPCCERLYSRKRSSSSEYALPFVEPLYVSLSCVRGALYCLMNFSSVASLRCRRCQRLCCCAAD